MIKSVIIYALVFSISIILCYIYEKRIDKTSFKNRLLWTLLIIAPTVILAGIRYGVGIDYFEYRNQFDRIHTVIFKNSYSFIETISRLQYFLREPLNLLLIFIAHNRTVLFFIYAFITMFVFFKAIDYYRDRMSITLSLFIFYMTYYLVSYNIIRQMIAVIIILYGTIYIFEKKFWKYVLLVVIAGMIHKTAYCMIVLYFIHDENLGFLNKIKIFNKVKINENLQSIIIYIIIGVLPFALIPVIPKVISVLGIYKSYLAKETHISFKFLLYVLPILTLILVYRKELLKESKQNDFFIRTMILQIPFQIMGGIIKYSDRFSLYTSIMQVVLIPTLFKNLGKSKMDKFIKISIIGWYLFYFTVMFVILNANGVMPYQTIFNK